MLNCWEEDPDDRPTFRTLKDTMKEMEGNNSVRSIFNGPEKPWIKFLNHQEARFQGTGVADVQQKTTERPQ